MIILPRSASPSLLPTMLACTALWLCAGCQDAGRKDLADRQLASLSRAEAKLASGDVDAAIGLYKEALLDHPRAARAHLDLAILLHDRKQDLPGAIYHYRRYVELRPQTEKSEMIDSRVRLALQSLGARGYEVHEEEAAGVSNLKTRNEALRLTVEKQQQQIASLEAELEAQRIAAERAASRPPAVVEPDRPVARTYRVQRGDTLASIAGKVYGDPSQWETIYEANRDTIPDSDRVRVGLVLTIP